jgi:two-component system response regulator MprA
MARKSMANVLVVENNDPIRCTLASLLQARGHQVDQAADGVQALTHFARHPSDVVLMDVFMPFMDGLEACRQLRQSSQVPIAMISANPDPAVRDLALDCGATAFISKPMNVEHLLSWIADPIADSRGPDDATLVADWQ